MRRGWYEKYIGYCFNDNGKEVILDDVCKYEDGHLCFFMHERETGKAFNADYKVFMEIRRQTNLPR